MTRGCPEPKDGHSQTSLILVINGTALTLSYIGPQYGMNQEFIADLYNIEIGHQVPTFCVRAHESLAARVRETVEKFSGV